MTSPLRRVPLAEQTAAHLRAGFLSGRWTGQLPGVLRLAQELVVSKRIVQSAVRFLEQQGHIVGCGTGRRKKIVTQRATATPSRVLRVAVMLHTPLENESPHGVRILLGIRETIEAAGHVCVFSNRYLGAMGDNLSAISRQVKATSADAWILVRASAKVIGWFVAQAIPAFAFGGNFHGLPVASSATYIWPTLEIVMDLLARHGHKRIVLLASARLRQPEPIPSIASYLSHLQARGLGPNAYNLPDFVETAEGLEQLMDELFRITPPTALLIVDPSVCLVALSYLDRHGLTVPGDVSVLSIFADPVFHLMRPRLARFDWPVNEHVRAITRWVAAVAKGTATNRHTLVKARFVEGESIGQAKYS